MSNRVTITLTGEWEYAVDEGWTLNMGAYHAQARRTDPYTWQWSVDRGDTPVDWGAEGTAPAASERCMAVIRRDLLTP